MAATATNFRSSQAPQRCSEPVGAVAPPVLVVAGDRQRREVAWRCLAGAGVPLITSFVGKSGHTIFMLEWEDMTQEHLTAWALPLLPLDDLEYTKETLHRYCQI